MLVAATVNIAMVGGIAALGASGSPIMLAAPAFTVKAKPDVVVGGQDFLATGIQVFPKASVIFSGEVQINPPSTTL